MKRDRYAEFRRKASEEFDKDDWRLSSNRRGSYVLWDMLSVGNANDDSQPWKALIVLVLLLLAIPLLSLL